MTPEKLRAVLESRTPLPWRVDDDWFIVSVPHEIDDESGMETFDPDIAIAARGHNYPDAVAIVAAVNLIGPALAVVEAARRLDRWTETVALAAFDAALEAEGMILAVTLAQLLELLTWLPAITLHPHGELNPIALLGVQHVVIAKAAGIAAIVIGLGILHWRQARYPRLGPWRHRLALGFALFTLFGVVTNIAGAVA